MLTNEHCCPKNEDSGVLVLGASGRLGCMLRQRFHRNRNAFPLLRMQWQSRSDVALKNAEPADILSWDFLLGGTPEGLKADVVLCLAGAVPDRGADLALNSTLAERALYIGASIKTKYIFLVSSAAVYGDGPFSESARVAPITAYGKAKAEMEAMAIEWVGNAGRDAPNVSILRVGNVAGADALLGPGRRDVSLETGSGEEDFRRSYIGPSRFSDIVLGLCGKAANGAKLPPVLNIALSPNVSTRALLDAAGWSYSETPVTGHLPADVNLDTQLLEQLGFAPRKNASAEDIWADCDAYVRLDESS